MVQYCKTKAKNFKGSQLCLDLNVWQRVTSDKNILGITEGDKIEFIDEHPIRHTAINPIFSKREIKLINKKINDLLQKGIIKETTHEEVECIFPIFIKHKPDGDKRLILNLKDLNILKWRQ